MPFSANNENENNKKFIKKFFPDEDVNLSYPDFNYRVRMAELTDFWPYYSEAKKVPSETQSEYDDQSFQRIKLGHNETSG